MKITQDVCEFGEDQNIGKAKALVVGVAEKAKKFVVTGSEIYHGNLPDGVKDHN
ncbi:MAG: hypothetical protein WA584_02235 [Pyrinomonadaceae bacterium]